MLRAAVLALLAAAALAHAGPAVPATVEKDEVDSADVSYLAAPGEQNRVVVREEAGGYRFTDTGAVLTTRSCLSLGPHDVFCPGIAETLIVETGDGADTIDVAAAPIAFAVGGDGDDVLAAARGSGGPGNDVVQGLTIASVLHGGAGDDVIRGGPRGDTIYVGPGRDRVDGGRGNDRYVVEPRVGAIAAVVSDTGRDRNDRITVTCGKGVRLTATRGPRDRRGRYTLPGGFVAFAGLDGRLPCA